MYRRQGYVVIETEVCESSPRATVFADEAGAETFAMRMVRRHLGTAEDNPDTLWEMLADGRSGYDVHVVPAPLYLPASAGVSESG